MQDYHIFLDEILIPADELQARIVELGKEISEDYKDKNLHLICILRGGVMFLAENVSARLLIAGVLILGGIALALSSRGKKA